MKRLQYKLCALVLAGILILGLALTSGSAYAKGDRGRPATDERERRLREIDCLLASNFSARLDVTLCESDIINELHGGEIPCIVDALAEKRQRDQEYMAQSGG
jgi:hypothetical protein